MAIENIGLQIRTPSDPQLLLEFDGTMRTEIRNTGAGITQISDTGDRLEYLGGTLEVIPQIASQNAVLILRGNGGGLGLITSQVNSLRLDAPALFRGIEISSNGFVVGQTGVARIEEGASPDTIQIQLDANNGGLDIVSGAVGGVQAYRVVNGADVLAFRMSGTFGELTAAGALTDIRVTAVPLHVVTQLRAGAGALATPPISFDGDRDTGFFNNVDGSVQFISNGVAVGGFDAAGLTVNINSISLIDGSAANPSLDFINSLSTGLFSPAVDQISIAAAAVEILNITATGVNSFFPLSVTGNITVTGTVDGRDIAVDGATLDALALANSVDVTLAGQTYLTLAGQLITANLISLTTHVTGVLPAVNGGLAFPLLAPSGAVATPSYSFSADPDTGIYWSATGIRFSVGAGLRVSVDGLGLNVSAGHTITIVPTAYAGTIAIGSGFYTATNTGAQSPIVTLGIPGSTAILYITAAGGAADWTWPAPVVWAGGTPPTLSTTAGAVDVIYFTMGVGGQVAAAATIGHI